MREAFTWICVCVAVLLSSGVNAAAVASTPAPKSAGNVGCYASNGMQADRCMQVACSGEFRSFQGTWTGPFWAYVQKQSAPDKPVYRPYRDKVVYSDDSCLKDPRTAATFIVGKETDDYPAFRDLPAKTEHSLLITGVKADGSPFLRTIGAEGTYDYTLAYRNSAAELAVWKLHLPGNGGSPEMNFTLIDGRDFTSSGSLTRFVEVTLAVGTETAPEWQGVVSYGRHSLH